MNKLSRTIPIITAINGLVIFLIFILINNQSFRNGPVQASGGIEAIVIRFDLFASGFGFISSIEFTDNSRLFVADTIGRIQIVEVDGTINPTLFLDLQGQVGNGGKQGLSGFVLHPDFENNGTFFVNYTSPQNITYLSRFQTMASDPDQADPNSEEVLFSVIQPTVIHNGTGMVFGPDGYLYFGLGDGGLFGDPNNNGQNGNTYLGAIMRIDVDGNFPYEIPQNNPFIGDPNVLDEIWAMGLRNPWRFGFDSLTGDFYIGDVGEGYWEEINFESAGGGGGFNYGWRCYEGFAPFSLNGCGPPETYTFPIYVNYHSTMCAIIGGYVYRGNLYPIIYGQYLFADFCSGRVRGLLQQSDGSFVTISNGRLIGGNITTFGQAPSGELVIGNFNNIYRVSAEIIKLSPQMYLPITRFHEE